MEIVLLRNVKNVLGDTKDHMLSEGTLSLNLNYANIVRQIIALDDSVKERFAICLSINFNHLNTGST